MSEPAAEGPRAVPGRAGGQPGGNVLTRKLGPLPAWAWLGIIGVGGAVAWYLWKQHQAASAAAGSSTAAASTATGSGCTDTTGDTVPCGQSDYGGEVATLQTEIMDLQQTPGPAGPAGPAGTSATSTIQVPDVIGQSAGTAHNVITAAGLIPFDPTASASNEPKNLVKSTSPAAGSSVASGSKVTLMVSPGVAVPKVAGSTAGTAHNKLVAAGLVPVAPPGQKASTKATGTSPAAGAWVSKGTKVTILT